MLPWMTSTWRAFRPSGGRRALTALDTASMPVSEDPPLAKARNNTKIDNADSKLLPLCGGWQPLQ